MTDSAVYDLARRAGVAIDWRDYADRAQRVSLDSVRRILDALGLPNRNADDLEHSRRALERREPPPLVTATVGEEVRLPLFDQLPSTARLETEGGSATDIAVGRVANGFALSAIDEPGYHRLKLGPHDLKVAVAPKRCVTIADIAPGERVWGLAAQLYGLQSPGDCGIGDMAGVAALAKAAAGLRADALALSPTHALFAADPRHASPYSPSNRQFYNPLHADPTAVFDRRRIDRARGEGALSATHPLEGAAFIDWPQAGGAKLTLLRRLFDDFFVNDLAKKPPTPLAEDFGEFRASRGTPLAAHAAFEALHASRLQNDSQDWNWQNWPPDWRDPNGSAVRDFTARNQREILFHAFLQWLADRSFAATQEMASAAGLRIGLIADLAVGFHGGGSAAWSQQKDVLVGLEIGAPPDLFNGAGQNWGLTTFSPRALSSGGFIPFIDTLRACLRHAGGCRVDHAMGLKRLWVVPHGAKASEGAYLSYPLDDLLRLIALESYRRRAVIIGEDLGTVPPGFSEQLSSAGIYGMSVLWFQRDQRSFAAPKAWRTDSAAMTSTHDLPTVTGWWRGRDIEVRAETGQIVDRQAEQAQRDTDRQALWLAFCGAGAAAGDPPTTEQTTAVADAAVKFIAQTPSGLTLLPLEDALALDEQPNLPGTIDEQPNWRRRYGGRAGDLLAPAAVRNRLKPLSKERAQ